MDQKSNTEGITKTTSTTTTTNNNSKNNSSSKPKLNDTRRGSQISRSGSGHSIINSSRSSSLAEPEPSSANNSTSADRPRFSKRLSEAERLKKVLDRSFRLLHANDKNGSAGSVEEDGEEESSNSLNSSLNSSATPDKKEEEEEGSSFEGDVTGDGESESSATLGTKTTTHGQVVIVDSKENNEIKFQSRNEIVNSRAGRKISSIFEELGINEPPACTSLIYSSSINSNNNNSTLTPSTYEIILESPKLCEKSFSFDDVADHADLNESIQSAAGLTPTTGADADDNSSSCSSSVVGALPVTVPPLSRMREHIKKLQASRFTSESKRSMSSTDVTTKSSVLVRIVAETRRQEKEIKAKTDEVDDLKEKINQEQSENKKLRKQLQDITNSQSETSRKLLRSQDVSEKLRLENKKKIEQTEKLERNISHMEDRIRNLEIRASEVDKAELTLDSTRRNLEASQQECRAKEKDLEREREKHDNACKELQMATLKIETLEKKLEDLKIQVRYELMKNENIERGLETIPRLKEEITDRDKKIGDLQKDVEDKALLLNASRKSAREYKEKLRDLERQDVEAICIKEELDIAKSEVDTLKRLMSGKDSLVLQKCQALDQAKSVISNLRTTATSDVEKQRLRQIQNVLDQLKQIHNETSPPETRTSQKPTPQNRFAQSRPRSAMAETNRGGIDVNHRPYPPDNTATTVNGKENSNENNTPNDQSKSSSTYIFLERFLDDTEGLSNKQKRAKTSQGLSHSNNNNNNNTNHTHSPRVHRSSSLHQLDTGITHNNTVGSGSGLGGHQNHHGSHSKNNGELLNRKRATSSHNIYNQSQISSATSPRNKNKKTSSTTTTMFVHASAPPPNVYTSEKSTKQLQYQPSLEYSLGVSTDDDLTTDTSHCHSTRHRSTEHLQNGEGSRKHASRPKSAFEVSKRGHSTGSDSESGSHDAYADGSGGKFTNQQLLTLSRLSGSEKDAILDQVIQTGDRVSIKVNQKPPRYGKKKPKPVTFTGIVKYKGLLDSESYDARIYVGMRLDAPLGESDGTHKGKRYMFTPKNHAKFFKIRDLDTVLDVASSIYVSTSRLIIRYMERQNLQETINSSETNGGQKTTATTTTPTATANGHHHHHHHHHKSNHHNHHHHHHTNNATPQEAIYANGHV